MLLIKVTFPPYFIHAQHEIPNSDEGKGQSCFCLIIELTYYYSINTLQQNTLLPGNRNQTSEWTGNVMVFETYILNDRKFEKMR